MNKKAKKSNQHLRRSLTGDSPQHIRGHRLGQEELGTGRAGGSTAQGLTCHFGAVTVADTAVEDI